MSTNFIASILVSVTLVVISATALVAIPGSISHPDTYTQRTITWQ